MSYLILNKKEAWVKNSVSDLNPKNKEAVVININKREFIRLGNISIGKSAIEFIEQYDCLINNYNKKRMNRVFGVFLVIHNIANIPNITKSNSANIALSYSDLTLENKRIIHIIDLVSQTFIKSSNIENKELIDEYIYLYSKKIISSLQNWSKRKELTPELLFLLKKYNII